MIKTILVTGVAFIALQSRAGDFCETEIYGFVNELNAELDEAPRKIQFHVESVLNKTPNSMDKKKCIKVLINHVS